MVTHGYVRSLINTAQRDAREQVLRDMRHEYPCSYCGGRAVDPDAELTGTGFLDAASDCGACGGTGIDYEESQPATIPIDVKSLRTRLGLTQAQFAEHVGCSVQAVTHWEQGLRHPQGLYARAIEALADGAV